MIPLINVTANLKVSIVTPFYKGYYHYNNRVIKCTNHKTCYYCTNGSKQIQYWVVGVIEHGNINSYKILKLSNIYKKHIENILNNKYYKNDPNIFFHFKELFKGSSYQKYDVFANFRKIPLDKSLIPKNFWIDLQKLI